jgi:Cell wall-active antibiotics response 4TMS YvqF
MPTSMWNKRTFSIATDELSALTDDEFTTVMGSLIIDLVSAPITPGTYDIRLTAIMGGIQIFLPAYAKVQLNGETFWGGKRIYRGKEFSQEMQQAFANSTIQVPTTPPLWATASYEEYPVILRFTINTTMGGANIYQLEPNSDESSQLS